MLAGHAGEATVLYEYGVRVHGVQTPAVVVMGEDVGDYDMVRPLAVLVEESLDEYADGAPATSWSPAPVDIEPLQDDMVNVSDEVDHPSHGPLLGGTVYDDLSGPAHGAEVDVVSVGGVGLVAQAEAGVGPGHHGDEVAAVRRVGGLLNRLEDGRHRILDRLRVLWTFEIERGNAYRRGRGAVRTDPQHPTVSFLNDEGALHPLT